MQVTLSGRQIRVLNDIINVYDPALVEIEDTNITGVVLFSYLATRVLVDTDGNTMELA